MTPKEHNKKAHELLKKSKLSDSSPLPWSFEWRVIGPPVIIDSTGDIICVLSTGTLEGPYSTEKIISNIQRILENNSNK